jgi:2,3-bisphosphoglycerate-independent phosphoglycerate mutase
MKYAVIIGDGMSDEPIPLSGNKTPLQIAKTPNMDSMAKKGIIGLLRTIPAGIHPGSDVANLSIMGYDPRLFLTGRGPFEALGLGIKLEPEDVAFRCNLIHLREENGKLIMEDYAGGHIKSSDARKIISFLNEELGGGEFRFFPGVSFRNLLVWKGGKWEIETTPPHDIIGMEITPFLPKGDGASQLIGLMEKARKSIVYKFKEGDFKGIPNAIWPWGQGKVPLLPSFHKLHGLKGAIISGVDLIRGIGICAGLDSIHVPGATGYIDTNYKGKGEYALKALKDYDFVYVHVEAPDEASHSGSLNEKVKAIESFDRDVVGTILKGIIDSEKFAIMVLPDHATPIRLRTHADYPVPFLIFSSEKWAFRNFGLPFDEESALKSGIFIEEGHLLMSRFIRGEF